MKLYAWNSLLIAIISIIKSSDIKIYCDRGDNSTLCVGIDTCHEDIYAYILDFATKKPVDGSKPEEKVRQEYEKVLCQDYDYALEQMDIEVHIQRGQKPSF